MDITLGEFGNNKANSRVGRDVAVSVPFLAELQTLDLLSSNASSDLFLFLQPRKMLWCPIGQTSCHNPYSTGLCAWVCPDPRSYWKHFNKIIMKKALKYKWYSENASFCSCSNLCFRDASSAKSGAFRVGPQRFLSFLFYLFE